MSKKKKHIQVPQSIHQKKQVRSFFIGERRGLVGTLVVILSVLISAYVFFYKSEGQVALESSDTIQQEPSKQPNILLITLDTTRADRIGAYGCRVVRTPFLDYLSRKGAIFQTAYTSVPMTLPSHASLLTGTYPFIHQVRNNSNYKLSSEMTTLPELLKSQGYSTAAFVSSFTVDSRFGLDQGFDVYNDDLNLQGFVKQYFSERPAADVFSSFKEWFDTSRQTPFFIWLHFFDPHTPFIPPAPFKIMFTDEPESPGLMKLYDGEVSYMDFYLSHVLTLLDKNQLISKTHFFLVGDHGEAFGEHLEIGHQVFCYQENIHVPLLYIAPKLSDSSIIVSEPVNVIDIMPSVLETVSLPIPENIQGQTFLQTVRGNTQSQRIGLYFESMFSHESFACAPLTGIVNANLKYIDLPQSELYDLRTDPQEKKNLSYENASDVLSLQKLLATYQDMAAQSSINSRRTMSMDEQKMLESLGYLVGNSTAQPSENQADPKDKIIGYNEFLNGMNALVQKQYQKSEAHLMRALELLPDDKEIYLQLANLYNLSGKPEQAITFLNKAREMFPEAMKGSIDAAVAYLRLEKYEDALAILKDSESTQRLEHQVMASFILGEIYSHLKKPEEAIKYYRKVYDVEPENIDAASNLANLYHQIGNLSEALKIYQRINKIVPGDIQVIYNLAVIYAGLRDFNNAQSCFQKALSSNPQPYMFFDYGFFLAEYGRLPQAIAAMQRYIELSDPRDTQRDRARDLIIQWQMRVQPRP
ncbi:sulfatase-like hydrolase/transferase [bacterium]|nr:sulfatase-like hydrolase/transferase [bacterium]